ncbi:MAG: peroxiredoxin [Hyphomonadaceae bacterium]|jgi:peroxiredoxin Q/BCP|nr:peroxiredoxin [Hyphomonadaceae bacterium]
MSLVAGTPAPDFTLATDGGRSLTLSSLQGGKVVVYFYPKDDTSGCTREAQDFTELASEFAAADTTVIGISKDSAKSHDRFKAKYELSVILAADTETSVAADYGVWVEKSMYGRQYMGMERATFLIGADGVIAKVWNKVKVPGHARDVLAAAQALG